MLYNKQLSWTKKKLLSLRRQKEVFKIKIILTKIKLNKFKNLSICQALGLMKINKLFFYKRAGELFSDDFKNLMATSATDDKLVTESKTTLNKYICKTSPRNKVVNAEIITLKRK